MRFVLTALLMALLAACGAAPAPAQSPAASTPPANEAIFAGGCFWCVEHDLAKIPGVVNVVSGYTGGESPSPTYENHRGHYEAVRVTFDPAVISYSTLVERFWRTIDPTDDGGQFCDRGASYRTAIFVTPEQRPIAEASKARLARANILPGPVATPILPRTTFTEAEDYHQDYAEKNPVRYNLYRLACGRDARVREVWADDR